MVAAVACAVGTPGVQRGGWPGRSLRRTLPRHPTGGVPPPPPRHPAASLRGSTVRRGPAVGWQAGLRGAARTPAASFRRARVVACGTPEYRNAAATRSRAFGDACQSRRSLVWVLLRSLRRSSPAEVFSDCDFNLGGRGFRDFRGRVVSRPRHPDNIRGHALGHVWSRFTGALAVPANTCRGHKPMIFLIFLT